MSVDGTEDEYEYPPEWTPPGAEPPRRPNYAPPPRSGLGYTGQEHDDDDDGYPKAWGYKP